MDVWARELKKKKRPRREEKQQTNPESRRKGRDTVEKKGGQKKGRTVELARSFEKEESVVVESIAFVNVNLDSGDSMPDTRMDRAVLELSKTRRVTNIVGNVDCPTRKTSFRNCCAMCMQQRNSVFQVKGASEPPKTRHFKSDAINKGYTTRQHLKQKHPLTARKPPSRPLC